MAPRLPDRFMIFQTFIFIYIMVAMSAMAFF